MNHSSWVKRAQDFIETVRGLPGEMQVIHQVDPPMTRHEADEFAKSLPLGLPEVLKKFMSEGSGSCECSYTWEPDESLSEEFEKVIEDEDYLVGGATLCLKGNLLWLQEMAQETATLFTGDDEQSGIDRDYWSSAWPFVHIGNGDNLALLPVNETDPPVVYLGCGGDSGIISPSFSEFLFHWEQICYAGPEHWFLGYWMNEPNYHLNSEHPKTQLLRQLMGVEGR